MGSGVVAILFQDRKHTLSHPTLAFSSDFCHSEKEKGSIGRGALGFSANDLLRLRRLIDVY